MPEQDVGVELFYDGAWNDLVPAGDVFAWNGAITITRGQGDESPAPRPAQIALQLDNGDDKYRTSNPTSALYGKAGRNTPIRVKVGGTVRGTAETSSWAPDQDPEFDLGASPQLGRAWVDVEAGGLLQRVNQWSDPLRSPMYRQISSYATLTGYWPLEDPSGSTRLTQVVPLGRPGTMAGTVNLAGDTGALGAEQSVTIGANGAINGYFVTSTASGWQVSWVMKLAAAPGGAGYNTVFRVADTKGRTWAWNMSNANHQIVVTDSDGSTLETGTASYGSLDVTSWFRVRLKVTVSGSTITYEPAWYPQSSTSVTGFTDTFSGTSTGQPRTWQATFNSYTDGAAYGHVFAVTDTTLNLTGGFDAVQAFNGYSGETAGARFTRLTGELGVTSTVVGTSADSYMMGPQVVATFPDLLREILTTEDGLIFDDIDSVGLIFLLRNARYNQSAALALTPTDLPALPREVTDDLDVHNIVTASNRGGGDFTVADNTGPLGTQDPPDGVGIYRQTVDVNVVADDDLPQQANWWLRRGTVDLPRYPQLTLDLNAQPGLITDVEAVDIGSVITITGMREYTVRLYVLGWVETIGTHSRTITFTCAPDQQFVVGVYDDTVKRYDLRTCTLDGDHTNNDTTLLFAITDDEQWSTTAEPYDLLISGELVTVTAMGARSGSGPYAQTATVTRSVNGIVKALPDGASVHIANPARWAL